MFDGYDDDHVIPESVLFNGMLNEGVTPDKVNDYDFYVADDLPARTGGSVQGIPSREPVVISKPFRRVCHLCNLFQIRFDKLCARKLG